MLQAGSITPFMFEASPHAPVYGQGIVLREVEGEVLGVMLFNNREL